MIFVCEVCGRRHEPDTEDSLCIAFVCGGCGTHYEHDDLDTLPPGSHAPTIQGIITRRR